MSPLVGQCVFFLTFQKKFQEKNEYLSDSDTRFWKGLQMAAKHANSNEKPLKTQKNDLREKKNLKKNFACGAPTFFSIFFACFPQ